MTRDRGRNPKDGDANGGSGNEATEHPVRREAAQSPSLPSPPVSPVTDHARIAEIQRRVEKATPGPWCYENLGDKCNDIFIGTADRVLANCEMGERANGSLDAYDSDSGEEIEYYREGVAFIDDTCSAMPSSYNAAFIAHARADIPYLLSRLAETEKMLAEADAVIASIVKQLSKNGVPHTFQRDGAAALARHKGRSDR